MVLEEERLKVLKMVQEGKLTAEEAIQLLEVLDQSTPNPVSADSASPIDMNPGKFLRVRVSDINSHRVKVNLRMPLSLVKAGVKLGSRFTPELEGIKQEELIAILNSGNTGQVIDVTDQEDGEHIEVFID